ncbi:MAG TPA: putative sugar nucleotidyl transferase [Pirellulales bacterium]|jgi:glucose-1-phosphate thymidylyltransferase|nr:putative sugar nucleotidyl transferase [Pirellulales bacterium]
MLILFEDELVTQLYPITLGKPAYTIGCGSYRLLDLVAGLAGHVHAVVRPHLTAFRQAEPLPKPGGAAPREGVAYVNARLVPHVKSIEQIRRLLAAGRPGIVRPNAEHRPENQRTPGGNGEVAVAIVPPGTTLLPDTATAKDLAAWLTQLKLQELDSPRLALFDYPHDIVRHHLTILPANLEHRLSQGGYREAQPGVFVAEGALLGEHVVAHTQEGPIVLDRQASIGPFCYLRGPAYVGPQARVIEHAAIKDGVSLGHTTKVGGEVEGSIIEPYTNKQHHGFLGHSFLGSWVNLGAGTCNSDLKNTYGSVNMEYQGRRVATGMQFVGAIVGDYAKTAINTGIFTGKTVGVCSMVYGFVTTNVPSFTNYARLFGQVTEAPVEVMVATQARMFVRRQVEQRPCDVQLLQAMYELTRHERQLAGEPLSL